MYIMRSCFSSKVCSLYYVQRMCDVKVNCINLFCYWLIIRKLWKKETLWFRIGRFDKGEHKAPTLDLEVLSVLGTVIPSGIPLRLGDKISLKITLDQDGKLFFSLIAHQNKTRLTMIKMGLYLSASTCKRLVFLLEFLHFLLFISAMPASNRGMSMSNATLR